MTVEYTARAVADLRKIAAESIKHGPSVAAGLEARLREVIAMIAEFPDSGPRVAGRPGVHVLPLVRYPYRMFYRVLDDRVRILHIRHTSRQPW